jgi:hypothetical protein
MNLKESIRKFFWKNNMMITSPVFLEFLQGLFFRTTVNLRTLKWPNRIYWKLAGKVLLREKTSRPFEIGLLRVKHAIEILIERNA